MLKTPQITNKTLSSVKYKKNNVMLNNLSDFNEDKIDFASLVEQGNDLIKNKLNKTEETKEYAIIKVYFK